MLPLGYLCPVNRGVPNGQINESFYFAARTLFGDNKDRGAMVAKSHSNTCLTNMRQSQLSIKMCRCVVWSMSYLLAWTTQGLWPILQPATRGQTSQFGFTFEELSCRPSSYTVCGFKFQVFNRLNRGNQNESIKQQKMITVCVCGEGGCGSKVDGQTEENR